MLFTRKNQHGGSSVWQTAADVVAAIKHWTPYSSLPTNEKQNRINPTNNTNLLLWRLQIQIVWKNLKNKRICKKNYKLKNMLERQVSNIKAPYEMMIQHALKNSVKKKLLKLFVYKKENLSTFTYVPCTHVMYIYQRHNFLLKLFVTWSRRRWCKFCVFIICLQFLISCDANKQNDYSLLTTNRCCNISWHHHQPHTCCKTIIYPVSLSSTVY